MPRVKLFNEDEILRKAMELFWKKGYNATSIQDLVDHLGINRASLYDTFGGKKELFNKAFSLYRQTNTNRIINFLNSHDKVKVGFRKLFEISIKQSISDTDRKGCFVINTSTELIPGDEEIKAILLENKTQFEKIFYNYLISGVEKGEISKDKDLKIIASLIFTMYNGIQVVAKVEPDDKKLISSIEALLSVLD